MTKIGLVGCGAWGKNYVKTIGKIPNVELIICDKTYEITNYQEITNVDKVIIATPPSTHCEIATHFLKAGIPVLLEKPVAETWDDTISIFNCAKEYDTPILVNNIHLFSPLYLKLRDVVRSWSKPWFVISRGMNHGPFRDYSALLDYGPHDLSMIFGIIDGDPIYHIELNKYDQGEIYNIKLEFKEVIAEIEIGNGNDQKIREFTVTNGQDVATYDGIRQCFVIGGVEKLVDVTPPLINVCDVFINNNVDWRWSIELNLNIMKVLSSY